ncbi:MAG TPA: hypothetical protein VFA50_15330 [Stellaceae bacterium]|nr:hypothetical protein [Stellaceae bacterium]
MTPEERDRLARVEERVANIGADLAEISDKLDRLIAAANMGRGAWWAVLRLGGILIVLGGAFGWVTDHWTWLK